MSTADAVQQFGVMQQSIYRRRTLYDGISQERLKALEERTSG